MSGEDMKIGLLTTSISNFGQKGFYNSQEIGLAKELDKLFNEVIIYKLIPGKGTIITKRVVEYNHTTLILIPSKHLGINGIVNLDKLDTNIDVLVYFSDTQLEVPKVYKWCKKNNIRLIPYIGVVKSHSDNKIKKNLINAIFKRNIEVYKKCICLVKTPQVKKALKDYGASYCEIAPVGLDLTIMNNEYAERSIPYLKNKWGFDTTDNVLLFIGRLEPEKQPVRLIEIFKQIHEEDPTYKLIIVGIGVLQDKVMSLIREMNLSAFVKKINKIPNKDIWELYRISTAFINLNQQEIFGMAILEAMYYECKVVALEAPGPSFIIENGKSGILCKSDKEVVEGVLAQKQNIGRASHNRVKDKFTWSITARLIEKVAY
jgi:1,2-diacylglycerol 3-alpha-glucosyltransferase